MQITCNFVHNFSCHSYIIISIHYTVSRNCAIPGDVKCVDNGTCIHSDMICNGISDCMDGSDEANCSKCLTLVEFFYPKNIFPGTKQ